MRFRASPKSMINDELKQLQKLADWLDSRFTIPGTRIQFGIESLLGLIPGFGDTITAAPSLYIVARLWRMGIPKWLLARMLFNVAVDVTLGSIPLLGDLFDIAFQANRKNVALASHQIKKKR